MTEPTLLTDPNTIKLFASVSDRLTKALKNPARKFAIASLARLEGYAPYLEETNQRVSTFKSFANPSKPVSLLDHFTSMSLKRSDQDELIDEISLLEWLHSPSRLVISATAGHGKSMLMRYIALSMYNNPRGKIPIFIELRHLNRMQSSDLLTYIHSTYNRLSIVERKSFDQILELGVFCFILDGFDELNHDIRRDIEDQIITLSRKFSENTIIVSGRPDERFESWRDFQILKVCPMQKNQVIELINKLEFDRGTRKRFIQKIETGSLYDSHESFLSTPLLAILMLLTFEENANIPDKMHLFYNKAFETLFHKHDALKEQYDRERKSGVLIDEFSRIFSVFCLNTYIKEKIEFNQTELLEFIKSAIDYEKSDVNSNDLLFDLVEAVCVLQKEGLSYFFVHRSFQEYFTAMFLSSCPEEVRDAFIDQVCRRYWDNVLPMLFDMSASQLEPSWVKNNIEEYLGFCEQNSEKKHPVQIHYDSIVFHTNKKRVLLFSFEQSKFRNFFAVMRRFYPEEFDKTRVSVAFDKAEQIARNYPGFAKAESEAEIEPNVFGSGKGKILRIPVTEEAVPWLEEIGIKAHSEAQHKAIIRIQKGLNSDLLQREKFLADLFKSAK